MVAQEEKKSNMRKMYDYYAEHPQATDDEIAEELDIPREDVRVYRFRLKAKGYIDVTPDGVSVLRSFGNTNISSFKQETYRELAAICLARIDSDSISIPQMIELIRELRLILKEVS